MFLVLENPADQFSNNGCSNASLLNWSAGILFYFLVIKYGKFWIIFSHKILLIDWNCIRKKIMNIFQKNK
jgi:hypothetical protein